MSRDLLNKAAIYSHHTNDCHQHYGHDCNCGLERFKKEIEKELSKPVKAIAWTGKGCGVITDNQKQYMLENAHLGGEFAGAARLAERHDIPLGPLLLNQMEVLTDEEILNIVSDPNEHNALKICRTVEAAVLKKLSGDL